MKSSSAQQMKPSRPRPMTVTTYHINMDDSGFQSATLHVHSGDVIYVDGDIDMTKTFEVTVDVPTRLSGLSSNPFTVEKSVSAGPFTISANSNDEVNLTITSGLGGGGDITTIHVDP